MTKKPLKIIGVNPGTRYLGFAIFQDSELRDWGIKVLKGKWSKDKLEKIKKIILSLIELYEPNILAIKKLHPSRSSRNLKYLVSTIKEFAKRKDLKVCQYSIKELERYFLREDKTNKKKLAKILTSEYPDLFHDFNKEKNNKNPYYIRMFEAVALAAMCFHQLDN